MAKRICLLTGNETHCTYGCYNCDCGGETALNDYYVPIYNIQRVCDIVKKFTCTSTEGEEIAEYIRNELEKMVVMKTDVQPVKHGHWILKSEKIVDIEVKLPTECSECDFSEFNAERYKFCPNCGAKMDLKYGEQHE